MELSEEEKELIIFSINFAIEGLNTIPNKVLKRKNCNKVELINGLKRIIEKF